MDPNEHSRLEGDVVADVRALLARDAADDARVLALKTALEQEIDRRRRAECGARIQSDAMQLSLDLLVREPDINGFFRVLVRTLVEDSESHACGLWLLDEAGTGCELWMAYGGGHHFTAGSTDWDGLALPRGEVASHLLAYKQGWTDVVEYEQEDARLPEAVRAFNRASNIESVVIAPLLLSTRNLGWVALSTTRADDCESAWRRALVEAMARQSTLALQQSRLAERSREEERRQAVLEERNRIARDIHDTLAQGFAAILMQLQGAQRLTCGPTTPVSRSIDTAIELARTHMIEARRSVGALRPQAAEPQDVRAALARMTDLAQRTTEVPIELAVGEVPTFVAGADREILAIAQEALTNAVRHARARRITLNAGAVRGLGFRLSIADDGRGIAKERHGAGFGMTSMRERADRIGASLTIVTAPRAGTEVVLAWESPSFSVPEIAHAAR